MKKWIAALLAMLLVISLLAGCSSKKEDDDDDDDDKKSSQTDKDKGDKDKGDKGDAVTVDGVAIDTILDKPEKIYNDESENLFLDIVAESPDATETMQIGMTSLEDGTVVIYFNDGPAKTVERVTEISADGTTVTGYLRADGHTTFVLDTESTAEELLTEASDMLAIVELLGLFSENMDGAKLRKVAPIEAKTGKVYSYALIEDGKETGTVSVDQKTGLVVYLADETMELTVNAFDLTDARIPTYKTASDGAAIGTVMEKPEKICDTSKLDSFYLKLTENGQSMEVHMKGLQGDSGVIALTRKVDNAYAAVVVEIAADDSFVAYEKVNPNDPYKLNSQMTMSDVEDIVEGVSEIVKMFINVDWDAEEDQLRKIQSANAQVYTYEILTDGAVTGTLSVDKATGLIVAIKGDGVNLAVTDFSLTDARLPQYK